MWTDPIVEEVRQIKRAISAEFNHDLDALCRSLIARQESSGRTYVSFPPRPIVDPSKLDEASSTESQNADKTLPTNNGLAGKSPAA